MSQQSIIDVNELDWKAVSRLKVIEWRERAISVSPVRYQGTLRRTRRRSCNVYASADRMTMHVQGRRV